MSFNPSELLNSFKETQQSIDCPVPFTNLSESVSNQQQEPEQRKVDTSNFLGSNGEPLYVNLVFFNADGKDIRLPYGHNLIMPACSDQSINDFTVSLINALREAIPVGERIVLTGEDAYNFMPKLTLRNGYQKSDSISANTFAKAFGVKPKTVKKTDEVAGFCTDILLNPTYRAIDSDDNIVESETAHGINVSKMGECGIKQYNKYKEELISFISKPSSPVAKGGSFVWSATPAEGEYDISTFVKAVIIQHGSKQTGNQGLGTSKFHLNFSRS